MVQRLIDWFSTSAEQMLQVSKWVSLLATIVGAYYFVAYLRALGIPFPADFSVLPSILLAVGVVTVSITAIVFIYILMAGLIQIDPLNMGYVELIHTRPGGVIGHGGRTAITTLVAIYIIPYLAWLVALVDTPKGETKFYLLILLGAFTIWACCIAWAKMRDQGEKDSRKRVVLFSKIWASVFTLSIFTLISSSVYVVLLSARGLMDSWDQAAISFVVFAMINLGVLYPLLNVREFNNANKEAFNSGNLHEPTVLVKRIYKAPILLTVGFLVLFTLLPPYSAYVGELTTNLLGLSSSEPKMIYSEVKIGKSWPPELQAECDTYRCRSVPVRVVLDLGQYLYVRPESGGRIYRLERKGTVESFSPSNKKTVAATTSPGAV